MLTKVSFFTGMHIKEIKLNNENLMKNGKN